MFVEEFLSKSDLDDITKSSILQIHGIVEEFANYVIETTKDSPTIVIVNLEDEMIHLKSGIISINNSFENTGGKTYQFLQKIKNCKKILKEFIIDCQSTSISWDWHELEDDLEK